MTGVVVWLTGLPSSGKSTLARRVATELGARGRPSLVLDGDEVRAALRPEPGYDEPARAAFYESLAGLAALAARQGLVVLVPATANRAVHREVARQLAPRFVLVFVDTPADECARRDDKGLYARADGAGVTTLPGRGSPYEAPNDADLRVTPDDPDGAARVVSLLEARRDR